MSLMGAPTMVNNGRVSLVPQSPNTMSMQMKIQPKATNVCSTLYNATEGQWEESPLSMAYFSAANIQIIQNALRAGVYKRSNHQYVVGEQDCDALKIVMRSVFLTYAVNLPDNIPEQIQSLNEKVIEYCVNHVFSEAKGYFQYLHDATSMYVPLAAPVDERQKDKNNTVMKPWF